MSQALYIGKLAERVGLNPKTIRYYEEIGLLPEPERTNSGYRVYRSEDAERLKFIRKAKALGLSLDEVREIIEIRERGQLPCRHVRQLLAHKLKELEEHIDELIAFRDDLRSYVAELEERAQDPDEEAICPHIEGYSGAFTEIGEVPE
ncbi:MAG: heavy metal-responsive transcriptional regulator [Candidatus Bipolaricaulia bacterium]